MARLIAAAVAGGDMLAAPNVSTTRFLSIGNNLYKGTTDPSREGNGTTMDAMVKKKTDTTVPASTSPAALQQCPDAWCALSWQVGANVQVVGGIAEGVVDLVCFVTGISTLVSGVSEATAAISDWDGYNARKYAEAQAQQALFAGGPGAVWDAITKPIVDDWVNNPGHALGGTVVTVGTFAIPGGGVLKGVRGVKAAEEAVGTAAKAADKAIAGVDDVLGGLEKGRSSGVRTVGSDAELDDVYGTLTRGGTPIDVPGYKGSWTERGDGIRVGIRDASKSGGRAIDIRYPDGTTGKIHIG